MRDLMIFILILGIIITLHELGHLIAAKMFNVYCREFAIGMGPKLFSKKTAETEYSLRALPLGGYVAMAGEPDEDDLMPKDLPYERTLPGISAPKRMIVYLAGIFMNILLFIVAFTIFFSITGIADAEKTTSIINDVNVNSPAEKVGMKVNDEIIGVRIQGKYYEVSDYKTLKEATQDNTGELTYIVKRDSKTLEFKVTPELDKEMNEYLVGISFTVPAKKLNILESVGYSLQFLVTFSIMIFQTIANLFVGKGLEQLGGPIRIYQETAKVANLGFTPLIAMLGSLSLNVAIFNLIPIPALDGGRVLLTLWELITGKPVNKEIENKLITVSFVLLLALMVLIIFKDIKDLM